MASQSAIATPRELPILFAAPMVRAILEGRKTQTRRLLKLPPWWTGGPERAAYALNLQSRNGDHAALGYFVDGRVRRRYVCPYGAPGDRLYVRETWRCEGSSFRELNTASPVYEYFINYQADDRTLPLRFGAQQKLTGKSHTVAGDIAWRPSIFMPRRASRITLEVTGVRVERLQDISEADAMAEGVQHACGDVFGVDSLVPPEHDLPQDAFAALWEGINGAGSWEANPFVWVINFRMLRGGKAG